MTTEIQRNIGMGSLRFDPSGGVSCDDLEWFGQKLREIKAIAEHLTELPMYVVAVGPHDHRLVYFFDRDTGRLGEGDRLYSSIHMWAESELLTDYNGKWRHGHTEPVALL